MSKPDAELSADRLGAALEAALQIKDHIAPALADDFKQNVEELGAMRKRVLAYGYHCRRPRALRRNTDTTPRAVP